MRYNGNGLTIQVNFIVNVSVEGFGFDGFVTKMQPFPMDGHYRTNAIRSVGHSRLDSVVPLMLRLVCCAMAGTLALYYRSLGTASTLLRMGNISG